VQTPAPYIGARYPGHFTCSAVKEPGHFDIRKSSTQVTGCTFIFQKVDDLFNRDLKTRAVNAANCFTVEIKQIKRSESDMVTFLANENSRPSVVCNVRSCTLLIGD